MIAQVGNLKRGKNRPQAPLKLSARTKTVGELEAQFALREKKIDGEAIRGRAKRSRSESRPADDAVRAASQVRAGSRDRSKSIAPRDRSITGLGNKKVRCVRSGCGCGLASCLTKALFGSCSKNSLPRHTRGSRKWVAICTPRQERPIALSRLRCPSICSPASVAWAPPTVAEQKKTCVGKGILSCWICFFLFLYFLLLFVNRSRGRIYLVAL